MEIPKNSRNIFHIGLKVYLIMNSKKILKNLETIENTGLFYLTRKSAEIYLIELSILKVLYFKHEKGTF